MTEQWPDVGRLVGLRSLLGGCSLFVFGLLIGPFLGLAIDAAAGRVVRVPWGVLFLGVAAVLALISMAPVLTPELKLGLATGCLLGLLLGATPPLPVRAEES